MLLANLGMFLHHFLSAIANPAVFRTLVGAGSRVSAGFDIIAGYRGARNNFASRDAGGIAHFVGLAHYAGAGTGQAFGHELICTFIQYLEVSCRIGNIFSIAQCTTG